jgi:activator of HSP90 ATPase
MITDGLTQHALIRMAQRAFDANDMDLIMWMGTEVEGGYLVREKDFQAFEQMLKQWRDRARRVVGKRVVQDGDRIVTAYHARRTKQRRLLRHVEQRTMTR